jgi:hypothetical protein
VPGCQIPYTGGQIDELNGFKNSTVVERLRYDDRQRSEARVDDGERWQLTTDEQRTLRRAVARLRAGIMAVTFGMAGGVGLFVATIWLVLRGGDRVGPHLGLLANYLPGYSVTWGGAVLGLFEGGLVGALVGATVAWLYNSFASWRGAAFR